MIPARTPAALRSKASNRHGPRHHRTWPEVGAQDTEHQHPDSHGGQLPSCRGARSINSLRTRSPNCLTATARKRQVVGGHGAPNLGAPTLSHIRRANSANWSDETGLSGPAREKGEAGLPVPSTDFFQGPPGAPSLGARGGAPGVQDTRGLSPYDINKRRFFPRRATADRKAPVRHVAVAM